MGFKPNDRVVWTRDNRNWPGTVEEACASPLRAMVRLDRDRDGVRSLLVAELEPEVAR